MDDPLASAELRRRLAAFVRRRVGASDVDDVVQTVLLEALASDQRPTDRAALERWLFGVARHKVADHHRKRAREEPHELGELGASPPALEERALVRWAERQAGDAGDAQRTLEWMAREGEGDKLEHIAEDEALPAARVRQRVSRMRRLLRERWVAELALAAALGALVLLAVRLLRDDEAVTPVAEPAPTEEETLEGLRAEALATCEESDAVTCLERLAELVRRDPTALEEPAIANAQERALAARDGVEPPRPRPDESPEPEPKDDQRLEPAGPPAPKPLAPVKPPPPNLTPKQDAPKQAPTDLSPKIAPQKKAPPADAYQKRSDG